MEPQLRKLLTEDAADDPKAFVEAMSGMVGEAILSDDFALKESPSLEQLFVHTVETHRVDGLIQFCLNVLDHALSHRSSGAPYTPAALRFARMLVVAAMERSQGNSVLLVKFLSGINGSHHVMKLFAMCQEYAIVVPVSASTAQCYSECLHLLLTFLSSVLFHPADKSLGQDPFFAEMLDNDAIAPFIKVLVNNAVSWGAELMPSTPTVYVQGSQPSLMNLYNLFGSVRKDQGVNLGRVIGVASLHIALILCMHGKGAHQQNAAQNALGQLTEDDCHYNLILVAVRNKVHKSSLWVHLIYLLLTEHTSFLTFILTNQSSLAMIPQVVEVLLEVLYSTTSTSLQYTTLAVLHLLSEDGAFNDAIQSWMSTPSWYKERHLGKLSLSSLCVISVLRTVANTAAAEKIIELATLGLGVIANLAPFTREIDAYAAQRLVVFAQLLVKRAAKNISVEENADALANDATAGVMIDLLVPLCSAILQMIGDAARRNDTLVYELLYHSGKLFNPLLMERSAQVADALQPLREITAFYESELASVSASHSAEDILTIIRKSSSEAESIVGKFEQTLAFHFEESIEAYVFFSLYIWNSVTCDAFSSLWWGGRESMTLFHSVKR